VRGEKPEFKGESYKGMASPLPYSLHVSSSKSREKLLKDVLLYQQKGFKAYMVKTDLGPEGIWFRCFVGCYPTMNDALDAKGKMGFSRGTVVKTPYAVHVSEDMADSTKEDLPQILAQLGCTPYTVINADNEIEMLSGVFTRRSIAQGLIRALAEKGINAQVVDR
jgi:hypothetical protein